MSGGWQQRSPVVEAAYADAHRWKAVGRFYATTPFRGQRTSDLVDQWLGLPTISRVLDVGCGLGARWRSRAFAHLDLTLADRSPAMVEAALAGQAARRVRGWVVDFDQPAACHRQYDAVVMDQVLQHFRQPKAALARAMELLGSHGRLLITICSPSHHEPLYAAIAEVLGRSYPDVRGLSGCTPELLRSWLDALVRSASVDWALDFVEPLGVLGPIAPHALEAYLDALPLREGLQLSRGDWPEVRAAAVAKLRAAGPIYLPTSGIAAKLCRGT